MKGLVTAVSVIAIANVLAMLGLAGWLVATKRVDLSRVEKMRTMLAETIPQQEAREAAEKASADEAVKAAEQAKKDARPPLTASERLAARVEATEIDRQRAERLRREIGDLQRSITERESKLAEGWKALDAERKAFTEMRQRIAQTESGVQFKKTLSTLEGLKPDAATKAMKEMMSSDPTGGADLVVSYLNSMEDRARTKIITEMVKQDPKLAADLLERLRTRGTVAVAPADAP